MIKHKQKSYQNLQDKKYKNREKFTKNDCVFKTRYSVIAFEKLKDTSKLGSTERQQYGDEKQDGGRVW